MKYPTSIRIRGYEYQIEYVKQPREVDRNFESLDYLGTCDPKIIRILATQSSLSLLDTLIHEILHATFNRNKMLSMALEKDMGEEFITALSSEIALILLDNDLVKFPKQPPITTRIVEE